MHGQRKGVKKASPQASDAGSEAKNSENSSATLQETLDWLRTSLAADQTYVEAENGGQTMTFEPLQFSSCTLVWRTRQIANGVESTKGESRSAQKIFIQVTVPLADIDPASIQMGDPWYCRLPDAKKDTCSRVVYFATSLQKRTIKREGESWIGTNPNNLKKEENSGPYQEKDLTLNVRDITLTPRIMRALRHAVMLCGGKVDPF
jgi:hypothetical protein